MNDCCIGETAEGTERTEEEIKQELYEKYMSTKDEPYRELRHDVIWNQGQSERHTTFRTIDSNGKTINKFHIDIDGDGNITRIHMGWALGLEMGDDVWTIQEKLREKGISFDTGSGMWKGATRDWEWDWSLKGIDVPKNLQELFNVMKDLDDKLPNMLRVVNGREVVNDGTTFVFKKKEVDKNAK